VTLDDQERIELGVELLRLRRREAELSPRVERARHRVSMFASDFTTAELRKLTVDYNQVLARIEEIEVALGTAQGDRITG